MTAKPNPCVPVALASIKVGVNPPSCGRVAPLQSFASVLTSRAAAGSAAPPSLALPRAPQPAGPALLRRDNDGAEALCHEKLSRGDSRTAPDAAWLGSTLLAPTASRESVAPAVPAPARRLSLEDLLQQLVRRVAWSGEGQRRAIRLELGAGAMEGAVVLVQGVGDAVRVHLTAPPGVDLGAWRDRIAARLAPQGIRDEDVSVGGG